MSREVKETTATQTTAIREDVDYKNLTCKIMSITEIRKYIEDIMRNNPLSTYTQETIEKEISYCEDLMSMTEYLEDYKKDFVCFDVDKWYFFILYKENDYNLYSGNNLIWVTR